jgi:hypothetical protein
MKNNILLSLFTAMLLVVACKKPEADGISRLFRPVIKGGLVSEGNWISGSWQNNKGAISYTVQISRDSFKTIDGSLKVDTNAVYFNNLKYDQLYQVQVRAIASDTALNSKWSSLGAIKTPKFPTILNTPTASEITEEAVKASWVNSGAAVTSIKILKATDSSVVKQVSLTGTDITNQFSVISGLTSSTGFILYLYSGTTVRGWVNFTTKTPLAGTLVDLRSIIGRPSVLEDTIPLIASGSTVILKRGETYTISSAVNLSKSITIIGGSDLSVINPPLIFFTNIFNFVAGSSIDYIDFKDVTLRGNAYGTNYIFNTTGSATVGRISFDNCRAEIFRGIARLQSGNLVVSDFIINNCILDSLSNYGVISVDNVTCKAENISIKNSTIYKAEKIITSKQNSTSINIENCTINEAPFGGNYLIDYSTSGTNNVTSGIKITNCIFGVGKSNAGAVAVRGVRVGSGSIEASNNYSTLDYTLTASTPFPISNLIPYTRKSTEIWQDPSNGDFKIIDQGFPGKATAGAPRWR